MGKGVVEGEELGYKNKTTTKRKSNRSPLAHPDTHILIRSLTHSPTHPLTHLLADSLIHSLTHARMHSPTRTHSPTLTHSLTHSPRTLYQIPHGWRRHPGVRSVLARNPNSDPDPNPTPNPNTSTNANANPNRPGLARSPHHHRVPAL